MSASARASDSTGLSLPKWQIALAIGAPVAIGLGIWYYRSRPKQPAKASNVTKQEKTAQNVKKEAGPDVVREVASNGAAAVISEVVEEDPYKAAQTHKNRGNKQFKDGRYAEAIKSYQQAIEVCPQNKEQDLSTFHQNRAAAYEQLKNHEAVIKDCTEALKFNTKYVKALHRRAKAYEVTKQLESSLEDITAVCILEAFQNPSSLQMADRILKELGKEHAQEALSKRQPVIPSHHFVNTFMGSFCEDPVFNLLKDQSEMDKLPADSGFFKILTCLKEKNYNSIIETCSQELNSDLSVELKRLAQLLRGTFHSLMGDYTKAVDDLTAVFNDTEADDKIRVNALIKRATLRMQLGAPDESLHDLMMAAELGANNADVYHHRGQVYMLLDQVAEAMADFEKAVNLNDNFPIALVQKLYTDYRLAVSLSDTQLVAASMQAFEAAIKRFPQCPECYLLFAQVLSDQQEFRKADDYFSRALQADPTNATAYVHRGLLQLQWEGKVDEAVRLIEKAIQMDDKCEFAYETLGTIEVQRGNLKRAIELFDLAIPLSKTEIEIAHLFSLKDAALAQVKVAQKLGVTLPSVP